MSVQTMKSNDAHQNWGAILEFALKDGTTVIQRYSRPSAVVVSYEEWERLQKLHSDLITQRQAETAIPWETAKAQLIADGVIDE